MYDRKSYITEESPVKPILLNLFKKTEPLKIFDIGACEGEESIRYKNIFSESLIFLFEPLPKNQELINKNIAKYELNNVFLYPVALSDEDGYTKFYTSSGQPEKWNDNLDWDFGNKSSSLLLPEPKNLPEWLKFNEILDVQTFTLDLFLEEHKIKSVDFVHMDVQGAELKVLKGAKSKLKSIKSIWLEVSKIEIYKNQPLSNEIEIFMKKNNFQLIKNEFVGDFGDQFYVNKRYFKTFSLFNKRIQFFFKRNLKA
jgi:FkbM family methyltransferase